MHQPTVQYLEADEPSTAEIEVILFLVSTPAPSFWKAQQNSSVVGVKINSCCMKSQFVSLYDACMMHDLFYY